MRYIHGWKELRPQSHAVRIGDLVYCSGMRPVDPDTGELMSNRDFSAHVSQCLDNLDTVLKKTGMTIQDAVKLKVYLRNMRNASAAAEIIAERFAPSAMPTATVLEISRIEDDHDVIIDCTAAAPDLGITYTQDETAAPYSGAVKFGDYVSCTAAVPQADTLAYDEQQFKDEVLSCFTKLVKRLDTAGADISQIFRTRVYVRNMLDRHAVNEVTKSFFTRYPLRIIVEVSRLPKEQRIAVECDAYCGDSIEYLKTNKGQLPTGPFCQGIRIDGRYIYCAGVRPIDPATDRLLVGTIHDRVVRCMENLQAVLAVAGSSMEQVFEARVYLRNMADLGVTEEVFRKYFRQGQYPVWTAVEIARLNEDYEKGWDPNHDVEIEVSAYET